MNEFDNKFRIITNEPVREQDEFARYLAPETAFDMVSKLIIQRCEDTAYLLDLNYRSTQNIVGASNKVIKNNKFKVEKDIRSSKVSEHKIVVYAGNNDEENTQFCLEHVQEFLNEGIPKEEILFLYRRTKMGSPYFNYLKDHSIAVPFKTIHAAKELEAKVVFIVGLTDGYGGFPDVWLDDRIFQTIKKANLDLLLEEERRLFHPRQGQVVSDYPERFRIQLFKRNTRHVYGANRNTPAAGCGRSPSVQRLFQPVGKFVRVLSVSRGKAGKWLIFDNAAVARLPLKKKPSGSLRQKMCFGACSEFLIRASTGKFCFTFH